MLNIYPKKGFQLFKLTKKSWSTTKLTTQQTKAAEEKDTIIQSTTNLMWPKKAIDSGIQGRKKKVSKRPLDFTGINKVPIVDKCPVDKNPPSACISVKWPCKELEAPAHRTTG